MPPPAKKPSVIPVGTVLAGKFRITREIGRGGMAAVYEAQNVDIGKRVAVKVLNPELINSAVVVERFLREARAAAAVNSPYICDVYDAGKLDDGRPFLLLELLEGESLYERMVKVRRFEPDFVVRTFTQVCRGLTKAHAANIIHRDLKPENIFLTKTDDGEVLAKILDFGLAKFYAPVDGAADQHRLTREGAIFGTPAYMSPEQVKGQGQVDSRADLWAIGCMVYECLVGRTVWVTEQGVAMIFAQIATAALPVPSKRRPDLPPAFDRWFAKALARDVNQRFQTAKELADELMVALGQGPPSIIVPTSLTEIEREALQASPSSRGAPASVEPYAPTERPPAPLPESSFGPDEGPTEKMAEVSSDEGAGSVQGPKAETSASTRSAPKPRGSLVWLTAVGAVLLAGGSFLIWSQVIHKPVVPIQSASPAVSSAPAVASSTATLPPLLPPPIASADLPKWANALSDGQALLAKGDFDGAAKAFKEASEGTTSGVPRVMLENLQIASTREGSCTVVALGRPRPFDLTDSIRRPDIVHTDNGPLVAWADEHEVPGQWHAWTVLVDDEMRAMTRPVDVTPEAASVQDPRLLTTPRNVVLLFSDQLGNNAGVFVRQLTTAGRILGEPVRVTGSKSATTWPTVAAAPRGGYWVAYADDPDKAPSSQLFVVPLSSGLKPDREPIMVAEFAQKHGLHRAHARAPSLGIGANALLLAYRVERARDHDVVRQRIALDDPGLKDGLSADPAPKSDRVLGEMSLMSDRKAKVQYPTIACDGTGCFAVWREEPRGDYAAFVDPAAGTLIWRKKFSATGGQVSVASDGAGSGLVAWYQTGRVRVAPITRDGIREGTTIARVTGEQPRPSIAPGAKRGEWLLAWTDYEAGHLEAYVARVVCK
jgi:serine/threonine protein kinase